MSSNAPAMGTNKVFILDKYFNELQKFWDTEKRLQDATNSGEAANLQTRLRSLSTELVTLRSRLHTGEENGLQQPPPIVDSQVVNRLGENKFLHSAPSLMPQAFTEEFPSTTLRSSKSDMTGSLHHHHNYSNVHTGPASLASSNNLSSGLSLASSSQQQQHNRAATSISPFLQQQQQQLTVGGGLHHQQEVGGGPQQQHHHQQVLRTLERGHHVTARSTPPSERQRRRELAMMEEIKNSKLSEVSDLIRLQGPLTEDAVLRTLQARFYNKKYQTNVGPILVHVNPYTDLNNPVTLSSTAQPAGQADQLRKVAEGAVRIQGDTGYPQAIVLSGCSGSGKTFASMVLLRQLFELAGGGTETDAFKHLAAAFTVLRSLGSAKTASNTESTRIGHFIEVQVSDGALYRTKIHCYFLDQSRVIRPLPTEKNYHIFYQLLAGLTADERRQLGLQGYSIRDLRYLNQGDTRTDEAEDGRRFRAWKSNLGVLGIPYMDVLRVMAAILLLGNIEFVEGKGLEVEVIGDTELRAVSNLIGVSPQLLVQGLTTKTHNVRGQLVISSSDSNMSNATRDSLAKALYCRTVATIVKRANSLKRPMGSGSLSSNESVHHEVASLHASTVGTAGSKKSSKSLAILNNAVRHATDGFIGVLDMFGFEDSKPSQLEQLCINLCSETMQHFFNTHTLKTAIESCKDEGIKCHVEVDYNDNAHCIDLISSLRTGLLKMLDVECSVRGCPETYVQKVKVQHKDNSRLFEPQHCDITRTFGIQHFAGKVVYDTTHFLDTNRDVIPDDLVSIFHKQSCNFGFATHLFGTELKALYSEETVPRGISFRISPTSYSDLLNGDEPVSTLTQDFHTRLDNLLRTLVHAKPHFVRCIRPNESDSSQEFRRSYVVQQIRSLQLLETVNLMAGGLPHRMRFKNFNARYRCLAPVPQPPLTRSDDFAQEDCEKILDHLRERIEMENNLEQEQQEQQQAAEQAQQTSRKGGDRGKAGTDQHHFIGRVSREWALGRKHIFLAEGLRQLLEKLRAERRHSAATRIQATWRGARSRHLRHHPPKSRFEASGGGARGLATGRPAVGRLVRSQNPPLPPIPGTASVLSVHQPQTGQLAVGQQQQPQFGLGIRSHGMAGASNQPQLGHGVQDGQQQFKVSTSNGGHSTATAGFNPQVVINSRAGRPRPQPISGTPPPDPHNVTVDTSQLDVSMSTMLTSGLDSALHPATLSTMDSGNSLDLDPGFSPTGMNGSNAYVPNGTGGAEAFAPVDRCDFQVIQKTCSLFGLDLERPPPVPPSRPYTVRGNSKIAYPQARRMNKAFPDDPKSEVFLAKGESVVVIGASTRRGHLVVEKRNHTIHVPYQYLELTGAS